jgi:hypothetical protein
MLLIRLKTLSGTDAIDQPLIVGLGVNNEVMGVPNSFHPAVVDSNQSVMRSKKTRVFL